MPPRADPSAGRMTRAGRWIGVGGLLVTIALCALTVYLRLVGRAPIPRTRFEFGDLAILAIVVLVLGCAAVGSLVVARLPRHPVGWLFLAVGVSYAASIALAAWAFDILDGAPASSEDPAWRAVMWTGDAVQQLAGVLVWLLALLFPDGRVPFRLPRWVGPALLALGAALAIAYVLRPGESWVVPEVRSPIRTPAWMSAVASGVVGVGAAVMPALVAITMIGLVRRARSGDRVLLQQLKWFALAGAAAVALGIVLLPAMLTPGGHPLGELPLAIFLASLTGIPIAAAIAVLRYRLYDIDVVIRRTLVYGVVVAILAAVYVVLVLALQALLSGVTGRETVPVAVSTLAIATLFGPVRARVRDAVDRRFYRSRYDAQRTVEAFAVRLRDEVELDAAGAALVAVAGHAVQPASVGVWLRDRSPG